MTQTEIGYTLPFPLILRILTYTTTTDPLTAFKLALLLRNNIPHTKHGYPQIYETIIPEIDELSIDEASARGLTSLLDWWVIELRKREKTWNNGIVNQTSIDWEEKLKGNRKT